MGGLPLCLRALGQLQRADPRQCLILVIPVLDGALPGWPRKGGDVWRGQDEAATFVARTVDRADADHRLREIIDAVRSNRVEDDFSGVWSFAKEDFERRLYRKRSKISVKFVELIDTNPVQGPETEVVDRLVLADFMAMLDVKERQIVVLLFSGYTNLTDIGRVLGYANHSAVSKRLAAIRRQAGRSLTGSSWSC
jgi:hypothetical protein